MINLKFIINIGKMESKYFQDHMPGNICFGCGINNSEGLQIKSYWDGDEAVCIWHSEPRYQGWKGILNGGILASLFDCHAMCSAMAAAYREEGRGLDTKPEYHYATASMKVDYLKPTPNDKPIELRAKIDEIKGRKVTVSCASFSDGTKTAEARLIAIRVYDSSQGENKFVKKVGEA